MFIQIKSASCIRYGMMLHASLIAEAVIVNAVGDNMVLSMIGTPISANIVLYSDKNTNWHF